MFWNNVHMGLEKPAGKRWQQRTDVPGTGWEFGQGVWWAQGFSQVGRCSALASGATMGN